MLPLLLPCVRRQDERGRALAEEAAQAEAAAAAKREREAAAADEQAQARLRAMQQATIARYRPLLKVLIWTYSL